MKLRRIEVSFPVPVDVTNEDQQYLDELLSFVCKRYEREYPWRKLWIAGVGSKMLFHPGWCDEDHPMQFDDDTLVFDAFERENYDWICETCGAKQGDHAASIQGGIQCEFIPVQPKPPKPRTFRRWLRNKIKRVWYAIWY